MKYAIVALLAAAGLQAAAALAQTAPGAPGTDQVIPEKDRSSPSGQPKVGPTPFGRSDSLSDKLDTGDGFIKPRPGVESGIVQTTPQPKPGDMPVISPRGTGGRPGSEPK